MNMGSADGGAGSASQGGTQPIYQNGTVQAGWQDVSYNVGGASSVGV